MVEKKCGERQSSLEPSSHKSTRYPISNLRVERGTHLFLTSSFIWPDRALYSREERERGGEGEEEEEEGMVYRKPAALSQTFRKLTIMILLTVITR